MNIDAGWKLYRRNPAQTPAKAMLMIAASGRFVSTANTKIVSEEMAVMPAASPSSPSIRLMTFANATR